MLYVFWAVSHDMYQLDMCYVQGLCKYSLTKCSDVKEKGIVIGFDGRHNSHRLY